MAAMMTSRLAVALAFVSSRVALSSPEVGGVDSCSAGGSCDEAALLQSFLHTTVEEQKLGGAETKPPQKDTEICEGKEKTIYPYGQAGLWGSAYEGWEFCAGSEQSPIDIITLLCPNKTNARLDTDYGLPVMPISVSNNGHALQVDGTFGSLTLDGDKYESKQFHFHHPSEHLVNGVHAVMEMHIVNSAPLGGAASAAEWATAEEAVLAKMGSKLAVVAIFFDLGPPNKCLDQVLGGTAPKAGCQKTIDTVNLGKCFKTQLDGPWWSYFGSLTTPTCNEQVKWNVMTKRSTISRKQLDLFKTRFTNNARPPQSVNGRKVVWNNLS